MRVTVWASSETERDPQRKLRWGDYWLKLRLEQELARQGWQIDARVQPETDVFIHCFGGNVISNLPAHCYNVLYIHSHPARLAGFDFGMYDRVVAGSQLLAERLAAQGIAASVNIGATDFKPLDVPLAHDAVFVGNNRGNGLRPIIAALGDLTTLPFRLEVWGEGWEALPAGIWQGPYIDNNELNALYSASAVVLNDTHADMAEAGIINPRVLDALKAGSRVFTDGAPPVTASGLYCMDAYDIRPEIEGIVGWARKGFVPAEPVEAEPPHDDVDWSYSRLVHDLTDGISAPVRLDLGCGSHKREGFIGVDKAWHEGVDVVWNIEHGIPVTGAVDYIIADNLMEHIGEPFIAVMNHCHKALRAGGRMTVIVPGAHTQAAFSDPTHVRYFTPETWDYFHVASPRWADYGQSYGIKPWRVLRRETRDRFIDVVLTPVKGEPCAS